jgi:hypothetical protein
MVAPGTIGISLSPSSTTTAVQAPLPQRTNLVRRVRAVPTVQAPTRFLNNNNKQTTTNNIGSKYFQ